MEWWRVVSRYDKQGTKKENLGLGTWKHRAILEGTTEQEFPNVCVK